MSLNWCRARVKRLWVRKFAGERGLGRLVGELATWLARALSIYYLHGGWEERLDFQYSKSGLGLGTYCAEPLHSNQTRREGNATATRVRFFLSGEVATGFGLSLRGRRVMTDTVAIKMVHRSISNSAEEQSINKAGRR